MINLTLLESYFNHLQRIGMPYKNGAKLNIMTDPDYIKPGTKVDCSGLVRYLLYHASNKAMNLVDGSQMQREYFEKAGTYHKITNYADINQYMTDKRLFICFIKPWTNGCRNVGHVWLVTKLDNDTIADTMESHAPNGVSTRPWNTRVLQSQFYSAYELPVS